jgi:hypothetical protein
MDAEVPRIPLAQAMGSQLTPTQNEAETAHIEPVHPSYPVQPSCHFRSCPYNKRRWIQLPPRLFTCLAKDCGKVIHFECYNKFVLDKHKMHNPFPDDYEAACCSKAHLMKAVKMKQKAAADVGANIPWDKDGKDGPDDPQNSMAILMEWLTTLGNYSKLKGDNSNGATKIQIMGELAQQINAKGVRKERTVKSVMSKLHHLTGTYRKAADWANQTGAGVLETEGRKPFNQAVSLLLRRRLVFS